MKTLYDPLYTHRLWVERDTAGKGAAGGSAGALLGPTKSEKAQGGGTRGEGKKAGGGALWMRKVTVRQQVRWGGGEGCACWFGSEGWCVGLKVWFRGWGVGGSEV